jgi:hypothetical protein
MAKREQILLHLNKTEFRVEVLRAIVWRMLYEKRPCPKTHRENLYRRNLLAENHKLTPLGVCYAKRWNKQFYDMRYEPPKRSEETLAKQRASLERIRKAKE